MGFSQTDSVSLLLVIVIIATISVAAWWRERKMVHEAFTAGSALLTWYTYKAGSENNKTPSIISLKEGELGDGSYYNVLSVAARRVIYSVQLTFQTELHVLAIARKDDMDERRFMDNPAMVRVDLEGDFPSYFHLYVTPGQEQRLRYILDPEAMVTVIDFCKTNSWELVDDELYIVVAEDSQQLVTLRAIQDFVSRVQPVLSTKSTFHEHPHRMSQKQAKSRLKANCPVCGVTLSRTEEWHECPNGHGYLLTGQELAKIRKRQLNIIDKNVPDISVPHKGIDCPACGSRMAQIPYVNGSTIIDTCESCHYRWLDGGEQYAIPADN